jgi:hypothetical protein
LIILDPLEDLLFAEIGVARRGGDIASFSWAFKNCTNDLSKGRSWLLQR